MDAGQSAFSLNEKWLSCFCADPKSELASFCRIFVNINRSAVLVAASEDFRKSRPAADGAGVFTMEYILTKTDGVRVHCLACIACSRGELLTLTVLTPEQEWSASPDKQRALRLVADSFRVL